MPSRVSLAELIDADIPLRPDEAVALVREVCRQHAAGALRGIPNATVIRLTADGRLLVEGPVSRDQAPVPAAAALLADLLPGFQTLTGFKVPGGLRLVLARATRTLDLPPFADVAEFCAALDRFAAPDLTETVRHLYGAWSARQAPAVLQSAAAELTISDVRRARRATGLSLEDVSRACGIPAAKLRELEWGYLRNWTADDTGREGLRRYARAAGVDEDLVVAIAWPLVESAAAEPVVEAMPVDEPEPESPREDWALVPVGTRDVLQPLPWPAQTRTSFMAGRRWLLALAAAIVLVTSVVVLEWDRAVPLAVPHDPPARQVAESGPAPEIPPTAVIRPISTSGSEPETVAADAPRPAVARTVAARPRQAKARARQSQEPARKPFFKRELFRIVIK